MSGANAITRALSVLRATPAQQSAIDAVLGREVPLPPGSPTEAKGAGFDQVEACLSLALDALVNAIDSYRERKRGRA